ncbi:MAG: BatA domain-containing protein, partial [Vicinamibacterales bacterium]
MPSFLYPAFLLGAIAAAVPIVLHLIKREAAPEVRFSAVRLLRRAPTEQSRWHRLREWLLLASRVAAILLLAAAFARPYLAAGAGPGSTVTIVAVDTSLSMGAPGRF